MTKMDTTTSSVVVDETYVSCIVIDGAPILPPIMTEASRAEMRRYRELAVERERNKKLLKLKAAITFDDSSRPSTGSSICNFCPATNLTSTPCHSGRGQNENVEYKASKLSEDDLYSEENKENVTVHYPRKISEKQNLDDNRLSTSTSTSSLGQNDDDLASLKDLPDTDDDDGAGNFAMSASSSTGTFIIRTSLTKRDQTPDDSFDVEEAEYERSEGEVEEIDEENEPPVKEPSTVIRNPKADEPSFKRKRRARYFDTNDDQTDHSPMSEEDTFRTSGTSSTSLSKYIDTTTKGTPPRSVNPDLSRSSLTPQFMPNAIQENAETENIPAVNVLEQSPSFTINTNFAATALALSKEKVHPRSTVKASRKSKYFASPDSLSPVKKVIPGNVADPNFDFILTSEVPASAVKFDTSQLEDSVTKPTQSEFSDNDESDKENSMHSTEKKKHVRKLSYTLSTPSAALLAATSGSSMVDGNTYSQTLAPIISAPSSVGLPSTINTPIKGQGDADGRLQIQGSTPSSGELDARMDKVHDTLAKLQQLNLGKGKKVHLERYLEELNLVEKEDPKDQAGTEVKQVLNKIQDEHEKQLQSLTEAYRQQALKMKEQFEREKTMLLNSLVAEKEKNENNLLNINRTTVIAAPSPVLADTSNLRNYYIANDTPTKYDSDHGLSSAKSAVSSVLSNINYQGQVQQGGLGTPTSVPEQLGNVQLSKLQKKMQKMNPSLFKYPADARSPLLKGLVFPDPLDRPVVPLKIPPLAYDPAMKPKFDRLTAAVKGYLTRRLLHSEKIQIIIQTVKDTVELLLNLYEECSPSDKGFQVKSQDEDLHRRLLQQLTGACASFHDVFFKLSVKERMAIIANDREKIRAKALKNVLSRHQPIMSPSKKNISNATLKSIERRLTLGRSPTKKDNLTSKKSRKSGKPSSYAQNSGAHSVKPKGVKSYDLSPKRRRMSYWTDKPVKTAPTNRTSSAVSAADFDQNGNSYNKSTSESARSTNSASTYSGRETSRNSNWSSDTFLIPSDSSRQNSWQSQSSSSTTKANNSSRASTANSRFSVGANQSGNSNRSVRSSTTRVPWKK